MDNLEMLRDVLGGELFDRFREKLSGTDIRLVNAADGSYVPKAKFDSELQARKQAREQLTALGEKNEALLLRQRELQEAQERMARENARLKEDRDAFEREKTRLEEALTQGREEGARLREQVDTLTGQVKERTTQLEKSRQLHEQIDRLTQEVARRDAQIEQVKKSTRVRELLREGGARNPDVLLRMIDLGRVAEDKGKVTGLEEQLTALRESDPYLFVGPPPRGGADAAAGSLLPEGLNARVNDEIRRAAGVGQ